MNQNAPGISSPSHASEKSDTDYSREELLKLLVYFEGELQLKEREIEVLKDEKARSLLNQAKYGKLKMGDPIAALNRDGSYMRENLDESVLNVYEYQQRELERICQLHKTNYAQYQKSMDNLRKQHSKIIEEIESDQKRKEATNAQSEDIMSALEDARDNLAKQLEFKQDELDKAVKLLEVEQKRRKSEAERTKLMVTYLLSERKKLLLLMQQRLANQGETSHATADSPLVKELRKEIHSLRDERNRLTTLAQQLQTQNTALDKKLKIKEEDIAVLRQNMLTKNRQQSDQLGRHTNMGGLVVANKGAIAAASRNAAMTMPIRTRLPNSSSFPSTIPGTSSNSLPKTQTANSTTTLYKKFPTISPSLGTSILPRPGGGRGVPFLGTKASNLPLTRAFQNQQQRRTNSNVDVEIDQLGMVIDSMSPRPHTTGSIAKRSSSLPRNSQHQVMAETSPQSTDQQSRLPQHSSNIPVQKNGNHPRNLPTTMPMGKHHSRMAHPSASKPNIAK